MKFSDLSEKLNLEGKLAALDALKKRFFPTDGGVPVQGAKVEADSWADRRPEAGLNSDPAFVPPESKPTPVSAFTAAMPEIDEPQSGSFSNLLSSLGLLREEEPPESPSGGIAVETRPAARPATPVPRRPETPMTPAEAVAAAMETEVSVKPSESPEATAEAAAEAAEAPADASVETNSEQAVSTEASAAGEAASEAEDESEEENDEEGEDEDGEHQRKPRRSKKPAGPTPAQLRARRRAFEKTAALLWSASIVLGILCTAFALIYAIFT